MTDTAPHPVDVHVGHRIRLRRKLAGASQTQVASALGLTFQQLQKYERGTNRISASKLHALALHLKVSIGWFFEGLETPDAPAADGVIDRPQARAHAFLASREGVELAQTFPRVRSSQRSRILALVRSLATPPGWPVPQALIRSRASAPRTSPMMIRSGRRRRDERTRSARLATFSLVRRQ